MSRYLQEIKAKARLVESSTPEHLAFCADQFHLLIDRLELAEKRLEQIASYREFGETLLAFATEVGRDGEVRGYHLGAGHAYRDIGKIAEDGLVAIS